MDVNPREDWGGGVLVSRDSWVCVEGRRTGAPRDGTERNGTEGEARLIGVR